MGHKIKCVDSRENVHNLASTGVPFTLETVQMPNLAIIDRLQCSLVVLYQRKVFNI
jgi:hypothetical protein